MIPVLGRATTTHWTRGPDVRRVVAPGEAAAGPYAVRIDSSTRLEFVGHDALEGAIFLSDAPNEVGPGPTIHLPGSLQHIAPGDVITVSEDGTRVAVAWKARARHNSVLLTERCDNTCVMCSQPPKDRDDSYLYGRARRIVDALPAGARSITLTGGEPTVDRESFLGLLEHIAAVAPHLAVHVLSNGRSFRDRAFARRYVHAGPGDLMVGVPLYSSEATLHDWVVQAPGAFDETIRGVLTLASEGARIELRVVLQQATVPVLAELAEYIARNLSFVDQVALMGLEMTGLARANASAVWIDPQDYRTELHEAHQILTTARIATRLYNQPLCVTDRDLWPDAVQSISDWKNDFPELCRPCLVRDQCAGVFTTSRGRVSAHLTPVLA